MHPPALPVIAFALGLIALSLPRAFAEEPLPEETRFINAYLQAHTAKDLDMALRLISWGSNAAERKQLRVALSHSFKIQIKSIELAPQKPAPLAKGNEDGITYKDLVVRFVPNSMGYDSMSFPIGWKDGKRFIEAATPDGRVLQRGRDDALDHEGVPRDPSADNVWRQ
jgi:hypothetical protein